MCKVCTESQVTNRSAFVRFVPVFKDTAVCKFLQALLGQSGHDKYNCIVYTDEHKNYFLCFSAQSLCVPQVVPFMSIAHTVSKGIFKLNLIFKNKQKTNTILHIPKE